VQALEPGGGSAAGAVPPAETAPEDPLAEAVAEAMAEAEAMAHATVDGEATAALVESSAAAAEVT
jgi:hypothetical protein